LITNPSLNLLSQEDGEENTDEDAKTTKKIINRVGSKVRFEFFNAPSQSDINAPELVQKQSVHQRNLEMIRKI